MPDAVSGATYSSKALIANMQKAFEQAQDTLASFHKSISKTTAATADKPAKHAAAQSQQAAAGKASAVNSIAATAPRSDSVADSTNTTKHTEQASTAEATQRRDIGPSQNAASPWTWQLIVALCLAVSAFFAANLYLSH